MQQARMHMNYSYLYLDAAQELVFSIKTEDLHEQDFGYAFINNAMTRSIRE